MQAAIAPVWKRLSDTEYITITERQGQISAADGGWEPLTEYSEYLLILVGGVWTLDRRGNDEPESFADLEAAQAHVADLVNHTPQTWVDHLHVWAGRRDA